MEELNVIKLYDAQITDVMPPLIAKDIPTKCISYAIREEQRRLMKLVQKTRLQTMIDELDEPILDVLAVELRSMYYTQDMPINVKRGIIKNTLLWHKKAGTPNAVSELIRVAFNSKTGDVIEWFDFDKNEDFKEDIGEPGTFDIVTDRLTEDAVNYFLNVIYKVKNTRSHLRYARVYWQVDSKEWVASGITSTLKHGVSNHLNYEIEQRTTHYIASGAKSTARLGVSNTINTSTARHGTVKMAIGAKSITRIAVGNIVKLDKSVAINYKQVLGQLVETNVSII